MAFSGSALTHNGTDSLTFAEKPDMEHKTQEMI